MRKVLSFVLVLTLVLSSFSMAFAADTTAAAGLSDINGNANEDAIQVAYDLGIVTGNPDGTFLPGKAVNRAEFAALITRALAVPDSALAGYTATKFKDTAGYDWAVKYLAFCETKGIMLGDGQGNAMPGRTISVNEAMTMALRAIGYTANSSLLVGSWPANYVSIAQNSELYDDVSKNTTVDKANATQIIYNLLTVQKVSVNSDGTTDLLWVDGDSNGEALNLLNSNLECSSIPDAILGATAGCTYDDAIINITKDLGAHGTAYINDDDELIAFTKEDSYALTGEVNDGLDEFDTGDVVYDIDDTDNGYVDKAYFFVNGEAVGMQDADNDTTTHGSITVQDIYDWAADRAADGDTVTINSDLAGKTIKDVYSVVAWNTAIDNGDADLADSDVQDEIADKSLLNYDFVDNDDDNIDMNSFELVGVKSLSDIAEDDVVYVYADSDDSIRKVAVGTETVEGVVDEFELNNDDTLDTITIGRKTYDVAPNNTDDVDDVDSDSEGTFYLDAYGEIYDFDGTTGKADTFGIVEGWDKKVNDSFDNPKVKLYTSDDSDITYVFSENYEDSRTLTNIDWTLTSDIANVADPDEAMDTIITKGALIGYSLDSSGDIDTVDVTSQRYPSNAVNFQSKKVLKVTSGTAVESFSIDSTCVVFTYKNDPTATGDYDISSLSSVESGLLASPTAIILNNDGDVVAIFTDEYNTSGDDYIYGVVNSKKTTKDDGGDPVSKFVGYIDGTEFSYSADDEYNAAEGTFDVYKVKIDSSNIITEIWSLNRNEDNNGNGGQYKDDSESGWINSTPEAITDLSSDKTVITTMVGNTVSKYTVADDAVVYKYDVEDAEFSLSKISALKKSKLDDTGNPVNGDRVFIRLYDTKGNDADGVATVVIFYEE